MRKLLHLLSMVSVGAEFLQFPMLVVVIIPETHQNQLGKPGADNSIETLITKDRCICDYDFSIS